MSIKTLILCFLISTAKGRSNHSHNVTGKLEVWMFGNPAMLMIHCSKFWVSITHCSKVTQIIRGANLQEKLQTTKALFYFWWWYNHHRFACFMSVSLSLICAITVIFVLLQGNLLWKSHTIKRTVSVFQMNLLLSRTYATHSEWSCCEDHGNTQPQESSLWSNPNLCSTTL